MLSLHLMGNNVSQRYVIRYYDTKVWWFAAVEKSFENKLSQGIDISLNRKFVAYIAE